MKKSEERPKFTQIVEMIKDSIKEIKEEYKELK